MLLNLLRMLNSKLVKALCSQRPLRHSFFQGILHRISAAGHAPLEKPESLTKIYRLLVTNGLVQSSYFNFHCSDPVVGIVDIHGANAHLRWRAALAERCV